MCEDTFWKKVHFINEWQMTFFAAHRDLSSKGKLVMNTNSTNEIRHSTSVWDICGLYNRSRSWSADRSRTNRVQGQYREIAEQCKPAIFYIGYIYSWILYSISRKKVVISDKLSIIRKWEKHYMCINLNSCLYYSIFSYSFSTERGNEAPLCLLKAPDP